jgi:lambda family phage portal protein
MSFLSFLRPVQRVVQVAMPNAWGGLEAGRVDRTDPDFAPSPRGPNALIEASNLPRIRAKARFLAKSDPNIKAAREAHLNNVVGLGIGSEADTDWPELNEAIDKLMEWAGRAVNKDRDTTISESQRQFYGECFDGGDVAVHHTMAKPWKGYPAMPAIELIEAERVDVTLTGVYNGRQVRHGVEFDSEGRVSGYLVYVEHPDDGWYPGMRIMETERYDARDTLLTFFGGEPNQIRGLPEATSVIDTARVNKTILDDFATLLKVVLSLGVFFTSPSNVFNTILRSKNGKNAAVVDGRGDPVMRMEPGIVGIMPEGTTMQVAQGSQQAPGVDQLGHALQRRMARGTGVPTAELSGDWSRVNFASQRAEGLSARKGWRPRQRWVWTDHTEQWRRRVIDWAIAVGRITLTPEQRLAINEDRERLYKCAPRFPGWEYVNPAQEAMAAGEDIDNGVRSPQEVIGERGGSPRQVARDMARWEKLVQQEREREGLGPKAGANPDNRERRKDQTDRDDRDQDDNDRKTDESRAARMAALAAAQKADDAGGASDAQAA